jgi:hypothetical protein
MLGTCPYTRGFPILDRFLYGTKAMALSVMTAASSERGCHYKSQFGRAHLGGFGLAVLVFFLVVHPLFHPLPGLSHFLCLAKESNQRKARPRWRNTP